MTWLNCLNVSWRIFYSLKPGACTCLKKLQICSIYYMNRLWWFMGLIIALFIIIPSHLEAFSSNYSLESKLSGKVLQRSNFFLFKQQIVLCNLDYVFLLPFYCIWNSKYEQLKVMWYLSLHCSKPSKSATLHQDRILGRIWIISHFHIWMLLWCWVQNF